MKKLFLAATAALALCAAGAAQASIIPVLASVVANGDGTFTYNYTGTLAADQGVVSGAPAPSELVIFDFAGYVPGSITVPTADIAVSTQLTSPLALPPGMTDNPSIPNLVFTWVGAPFNTSGPAPADIAFSGLSAKSTLGASGMGAFSALAVKNTGAQAGTLTLNQGYVGVPVGSVPEPASWSLMILGFGGLGAVLRGRRNSGAAPA